MKLKKIAVSFALLSILALPNLLIAQNAQQPNNAPVAKMTEVVEGTTTPQASTTPALPPAQTSTAVENTKIPPPAEASNIAPLPEAKQTLPPSQNSSVVENAKMPPPPAEAGNIAPLPEVKQPAITETPAIPVTTAAPQTKDLKPPFTVTPETYFVKANGTEHWQQGFENLVEGFYGVQVALNTLTIKDTEKPIWFDDAISYINTELQAQINKTFSSDTEQKENHKNIIRKMFKELIPIESIALNKDTYHVLVSNYRVGNNTIEKEWFSVPTNFITEDELKEKPTNTTPEKIKANFDNAKQHRANPMETDKELMRHNESSKVWNSKQKKRK